MGREGYAKLWRVEELAEVNARYAELAHLAGWVIFASDMGGEAYVFDADGEVLMVPWIAAREDAVPQGGFSDFIRRLGSATQLDD